MSDAQAGGGVAIEDQLLSELLDSALSDFKTAAAEAPPPSAEAKVARSPEAAKQPETEKTSQSSTTKKPSASSSRAASNENDLANIERMFGGLASALGGGMTDQQVDSQMNALMQLLKREDPTLFSKFQTLSDRAAKLDDESSETEFASILQDTLSYLNDGLKDEEDESPSTGASKTSGRAAAASASGSASTSRDRDEQSAPMANLLDSASEMMRSLLARSVFYPLIKSLTTRYPEWLATNRARLSPTELQKHESQSAALFRIREVYERSGDQPELLSTADFDSVIELLREAQSYGDPPSELLDETGASAIDTLGRQACVVM